MKIVSSPIRLMVFAAAISTGIGSFAQRLPATDPRHLSSLKVRLTLVSGASQTATLEGVGCSTSICSRVSVDSRGRGEAIIAKTWLDSIAGIQEITKDDALIRFKDGAERRLSIVPLNRVLYIQGPSGSAQKIDLAKLKSVEFL